MRSSSARFASQERFGSVLGSILGPSGPQNLCSRRGESIDFRKSAFPLSILILISKSPLKTIPRRPQWRSRRVQSLPKSSQTFSETLFRRLRGSLGGLLGELGFLERPRDGPGGVLVPFGTHSTSILDHFALYVGPIFHVLGNILNEFSLRTFFAGRDTRKRHQRQESTSDPEEASRRQGRRDPEG